METHKDTDTRDGPAVAALVTRIMRDCALTVLDMTGGWGHLGRRSP